MNQLLAVVRETHPFLRHRLLHTGAAPLVVGVALLFFGRRLFWLFVAGVGFLYGLRFAPALLQGGSEFALLLVALFCGLVGALLAVFAQKIAVGVAGFCIGGYLVVSLISGGDLSYTNFPIIPFLIGGVIGALFVASLFRWALIILSSLAGSVLIVHPFDLATNGKHALLLVLTLVGIYVQGGFGGGRRAEERER